MLLSDYFGIIEFRGAMENPEIIEKLNQAGLVGRSGSRFPTGKKWELFLLPSLKAKKSYVVCNAAEGELDCFKDEYILRNYSDEALNGLKIALTTFKNSRGIIYLKQEYFQKYDSNLKEKVNKIGLNIRLVKKTGGYLSGEETVLIKAIENQRLEPSQKPPYPTSFGIDGYPTLINNIETFYHISKISKNEYNKTRFYSIEGNIENSGVYEFDENETVFNILKKSNNLPQYDFFVVSGGALSGEVLLKTELNKSIKGIGSILVLKLRVESAIKILKQLSEIYLRENCDKCVPCREGIYRLNGFFESGYINDGRLKEIIEVLKNSSFCQLGKSAGQLIEQIYQKIYLKQK